MRHTLGKVAFVTSLAIWPLNVAAQEVCPIKIDFTQADAGEYWQTVNDGVMGGRSSGGSSIKDDYMVFEGNINTNGGGFSSIRAFVEPGALQDVAGLKMKVRSDGRGYKITLRTDALYRGRSIAFQAKILGAPKDEWAEVYVPFSALSGSVFGRAIKGANFDKSNVRSVGIILADGQDGPFRLDIKSIEGC